MNARNKSKKYKKQTYGDYMKFCNSNPFVRYAMTIQIFNNTEYSSSYDCRLFYVLGGKAPLHINNEEYNLSKNDILLWPSGCIYKFETENH